MRKHETNPIEWIPQGKYHAERFVFVYKYKSSIRHR